MSVIVNTQPVNVEIVTGVNVDIITEPINVEVNAARGADGVDGETPTRLLYVADIEREGNFLGNINVDQVILNNTGVTFTWMGTGTEAIMSTSVAGYVHKILSLTWIHKQGTDSGISLRHHIDNNNLNLSVMNGASMYRISIEFYNY